MAGSTFLVSFLRAERDPFHAQTAVRDSEQYQLFVPEKPSAAFMELATKSREEGGAGLTHAQAEHQYESIRDFFPDRLDYTPEMAERWGPEQGNKHVMEYLLAKSHEMDAVLTADKEATNFHEVPVRTAAELNDQLTSQRAFEQDEEVVLTSQERWTASDIQKDIERAESRESALSLEAERGNEQERELSKEDA